MLKFFGKAILWAAIVWFVGSRISSLPLWAFLIAVYAFAAPVILSGVYSSTLRQIRRLSFFSSKGWLFALLSGRPLKVLFWVIWALASSFFLLLQFQHYQTADWVVFFLIIPVFYAVYLLFYRNYSA